MGEEKLGLGVIGCGGFGLFAMQQFVQVPDVKLVAMAGTHREAAYAAAQRFGIPDPVEPEEMVKNPDIDIVYIATPPFLHHSQGMLALDAGKHVICEKPLAMNVAEANELVETAQEKGLMMVTNLMQRYNPLFEAVKKIVDGQLLGDFLHGFFENYAGDEGLSPEHWFWDREKSGGIFIEHAVHFFDLFAGWFGPGLVESAQCSIRPGTDIEDQVNCAVRYGDAARVNFYHGFTQTGRMDRQEMRLLFERGDICLFNWIPTLVRVNAIADERTTRELCDLLPGARLDASENYPPKDRPCKGRHKELDIYQKFTLTYGEGVDKLHRYGELLRAMLTDQSAWLRDPSHERVITEANGRTSLVLAEEATKMAHDH